MAESMHEMLRQDMQCEGLLECFNGFRELDKDVFRVLTESAEPLTIDEIATEVDRERSTAYRSVQCLLQVGFVQKSQVNYDQGGYYHVSRPTSRKSPTTCNGCSTTGTRKWKSSSANSARSTNKKADR